ncbi:hypothetical protein [Caballeronia sp. LZ035]|uniref:hypothetical protein n=1 Tax=Caballeronia sp. LZ035 TaxID=3038568 RepID=UPI00285D86A3|nr:hypothetical protein [Caballeronia sp. LZ035]MDR5758673.1 hypothetical protein [Caballeronia sp. LZ035]
MNRLIINGGGESINPESHTQALKDIILFGMGFQPSGFESRSNPARPSTPASPRKPRHTGRSRRVQGKKLQCRAVSAHKRAHFQPLMPKRKKSYRLTVFRLVDVKSLCSNAAEIIRQTNVHETHFRLVQASKFSFMQAITSDQGSAHGP